MTLYNRTQTGTDDFRRPIYSETAETVQNVLVAPVSAQEILDIQNLTGKKAVYQLGIPKGDTHEWENRRVDFFGQSFRVIRMPTMGIEALIPLSWNKNVVVEHIG